MPPSSGVCSVGLRATDPTFSLTKEDSGPQKSRECPRSCVQLRLKFYVISKGDMNLHCDPNQLRKSNTLNRNMAKV